MYNFFTFSHDGENFASSWFIGATSKVVPDNFYQMLTVQGKLPTRWTIPLVFALMPNKLH